jgi:hypothetical protein
VSDIRLGGRVLQRDDLSSSFSMDPHDSVGAVISTDHAADAGLDDEDEEHLFEDRQALLGTWSPSSFSPTDGPTTLAPTVSNALDQQVNLFAQVWGGLGVGNTGAERDSGVCIDGEDVLAEESTNKTAGLNIKHISTTDENLGGV